MEAETGRRGADSRRRGEGAGHNETARPPGETGRPVYITAGLPTAPPGAWLFTISLGEPVKPFGRDG